MDEFHTKQFMEMTTTLARYKEIITRGNEDIRRLDTKCNELQVEVATISSHLSDNIESFKNHEMDFRTLMSKHYSLESLVQELNSKMNDILRCIEDIKRDLRDKDELCRKHTAVFDKNLDHAKGEEEKLIIAINNLKTDISDIEQDLTNTKARNDERFRKLELIPTGWKIVSWIVGILAAVLIGGYSIYETIIKILDKQ